MHVSGLILLDLLTGAGFWASLQCIREDGTLSRGGAVLFWGSLLPCMAASALTCWRLGIFFVLIAIGIVAPLCNEAFYF